MLIVDNVLGNIHTNELLGFEVQAKQKTGHAEHVEISFHDAQRRRLRLTMSTGTEVGINLTDTHGLHDGDVLCSNADPTQLVVIHVAPAEAMALRMTKELPADELFAYGVRLGHMLGNQHWPVTVEHDVVLTPVNIDRKVMETVVKTHGFDGIEWEFIPVTPGRVPTGMPHIHTEH